MHLTAVEQPRDFSEILIHFDESVEEHLAEHRLLRQRMPSASGLFEVDVKVTDQVFILSNGQLERAERLHEGRVGREYLLHVRRENFATVERNAGVVPAID